MIQVEGLTKYYGAHAAIRDLDFTIERGEVIGFLGLNGAGKSTTLKILGCVLLPTSGRVRIDGQDVVGSAHDLRKRIGFLPDTPPLYEEMTVGGYLAFVAQLRGVTGGEARARVEEVESRTALRDVDREIIGSLSHGYRQRVGVAQALVHRPDLLILDEPTGGLDPVQIVEMRALIQTLKGAHTVLVSSHILSEISQTCDRLLVIQGGEIVAQGTEEELARRAGGLRYVEVEISGTAPQRALAVLQAIPFVVGVRVQQTLAASTVLRVDGPAELSPQLIRSLVQADVDILRVQPSAERLESIFLKLTHGTEATS